jgi:hypothetical protein
MVRRPIFVVVLFSVLALTALGAATPQALLDLGLRAFRSGDYQSAVVDLQAAAQGFLSPEQMQTYVNTGKFEDLRAFEKSLVYLALAQFRLGREDDARETIMRLVSAERIAPTYATLPLEADAAEFERLVAALVPTANLPRNVQFAASDPSQPRPRGDEEKVAVRKTIAQERAERQAAIEEFIAKERERIQREADARIAAETAAAQRNADARVATQQANAEARIAAEQAAAKERIAAEQAAAQQRIAAEKAAAERAAAERVAAAESQAAARVNEVQAATQERVETLQTEAQRRVAEAQAEADRRVAAAEAEAQQRLAAAEAEAKRESEARIAEIERQTQERIAAARAASEREISQRLTEAEASSRKVYLTSLRQAEAFASNGLISDANEVYVRLLNSQNVPREVVAEAAIGLYRTGAFRESVGAFRKLNTFLRGEEDLRYYHAVALYEIGDYPAAQKELACALPFIQVTDEVARYRMKIEQSSAPQAAKK